MSSVAGGVARQKPAPSECRSGKPIAAPGRFLAVPGCRGRVAAERFGVWNRRRIDIASPVPQVPPLSPPSRETLFLRPVLATHAGGTGL